MNFPPNNNFRSFIPPPTNAGPGPASNSLGGMDGFGNTPPPGFNPTFSDTMHNIGTVGGLMLGAMSPAGMAKTAFKSALMSEPLAPYAQKAYDNTLGFVINKVKGMFSDETEATPSGMASVLGGSMDGVGEGDGEGDGPGNQ